MLGLIQRIPLFRRWSENRQRQYEATSNRNMVFLGRNGEVAGYSISAECWEEFNRVYRRHNENP